MLKIYEGGGRLIAYDPDKNEAFYIRELKPQAEIVDSVAPVKIDLASIKRIKKFTTKPTSAERFKKWTLKYDACLGCGTTEKKHQGQGLCTTCYFRKHVKGNFTSPGLKPTGPKKYTCQDCGEKFTSSASKIDVSCNNCGSVHIA